MYLTFATLLVAFLITLLSTPIFMSAARKKGIVGKDLHKKDKLEVPELGGLAIALGIVAAILFTIGVNSFVTLRVLFGVQQDATIIVYLLAALSVILMIELIGFVDDVLGVRQHVKLLLPIAAALPLMAIKVTSLDPLMIPFIGVLPIPPIVYVLFLIPIGVTAATNLTNTFAGFNGVEAGMGAVIAATLFAIGWHLNLSIVMILSAALLGALLAFLVFNRYPSKVFPDDVGTLLIGGVVAATVILGRIEFAGALLLLPYMIDFVFFKLPNRLPSKGWGAALKEDGKLHYDDKPVHFAQWIINKTNGIKEQNLVLLLIGFEVILGVVALYIYF